jgi:hypothetical protein
MPTIQPLDGGSILVCDIAIIESGQHRSWDEALDLAGSMIKDPAGYLRAVADFNVPGVRDVRPSTRLAMEASATDDDEEYASHPASITYHGEVA